jgi:Type II secretion system (T2SS), protein M subtype b
MSQEQPIQAHAVPARRQIPIRWDQLKRSSLLTVIGIPELIGLSLALLMAVITVFAYFSFFLPSRSRLRGIQVERDLLQVQVRASQKNFQDNNSTREAVDKISASLETFESNWLASRDAGRMSLYTTLNDLIRSNGLRNTAGPSYNSLEPLGTKPQIQPTATADKQNNAKWQTIYPGIAVSVTVEGPYQSVWHFVRDIETSRQFLIINAVEIESVNQNGANQLGITTQPIITAAPKSARNGKPAPPVVTPPVGGRGALVSLRLDLATYFRQDNREIASKP